MNSRPSPGLPLSVLLSRLRRLHRPTVALLTVVALVRPVFSVTGATDALGRPLTPLLLTC